MFFSLLTAWLAAQTLEELKGHLPQSTYSYRALALVAALLIIGQYGIHLYSRQNPLSLHYNLNVSQLGMELKKIVKPDELIIVRSIARERERGAWGERINNFEDPVLCILLTPGGGSD